MWTTVRSGAKNSAWGSSSTQPRQMPSAFSGGGSRYYDDERTMKRREYERMNAETDAAIKSREAREAKEKRDAAAAKERDALALDSESSYPSLGGNSVAAPSKFSTHFRDKVAAMVAREKEIEELRSLADAAALEAASDNWTPMGLSVSAQRRRILIGTRCFDDGPEDYDGPEEDFGDNTCGDEEEDENNGDEEHNAHLGDIHRRNKNSLY